MIWFLPVVLSGDGPAPARAPPIERPTKFELVVNLKAANALGLSIPNPLPVADEAIE